MLGSYENIQLVGVKSNSVTSTNFLRPNNNRSRYSLYDILIYILFFLKHQSYEKILFYAIN